MRNSRTPREHIEAVVAAHGELTAAVTDAARLMAANGRGEYAALLDDHRAELNVAIGELSMWLNSFGDRGQVDPGLGMRYPALDSDLAPSESFERDLLAARETLKARRSEVLARVAAARSALHLDGLPGEEITAYRRVVRLWAGEAIDVVAAVHRLTAADRYIRELGTLKDKHALRRDGGSVLRQWMGSLEAVDRDGELELAEFCGYGELVEWYRAEAV
ncbi:hypothetical protein C731_3602 [Mycolicibacterium hassiacum DSM 44199]|jgi:hypothetical protein|uniref:Uncharacterized protein n=1 Tax=Mycolicibacterium hassiacum (strain DSM 44199 / CIP 105218 / JCM 12690 / 3849) TaxID=1122247 RepID=K5BAL1_MYCHD|nr:hypothetical protein [Mycolicibacterium hassiacum]EKF22430.1 hypothetical protein C731_3602 [Mycolicibacterium hassiacum DSM 44199]MBX5485873.1 hypothetical protein [Mycolicibacterium hassiacum]MDA4084928.1 hypothetical protein [Mycolicibacterium hassiacum DSM 44199]PZN23266.1 MAG: hypothetical protein DIU75_05810 [Mycolicibacterium hassiacum]VCT91756.1 hypothetical protein MHAS_03475 [Mycolicibacterium hassiacum DSM 44199]